jgi:hypothetical protein
MFQDHYLSLRHQKFRKKNGKLELQPVMMTTGRKLHLAWAVYNITALVFSAFSEISFRRNESSLHNIICNQIPS